MLEREARWLVLGIHAGAMFYWRAEVAKLDKHTVARHISSHPADCAPTEHPPLTLSVTFSSWHSHLAMVTGYGALASMMASHQDIEAFRKFSSMNVENILHMQAELQHLEMIINEIRKMPELNSFDRIWIDCPEHMSEDDIRKIFERSRTLLDQYCKYLTQTANRNSSADGGTDRTILQTAKVNALNPPPKDNLKLRSQWYDEESGGNQFLHGVEAGIFRDQDIERDLMTLKEDAGEKDPLARFLSDRIVPLYHRIVGHRIHRSMAEKPFDGQYWEYRPQTLVQIGNMFCMILSAIIPAFSILVLFSVQSIEGRLIAISAMSLVFSLVMNVIAQRRADVFMSTTGFAAVLVVFVGSANVMNG